MNGLQRWIYGCVVRLHPAAFRQEYGFEMLADFADALHDRRVRGLYWDGVVSLGRQWMFRGSAAEPMGQTVAGPSLLSGRYGMIGEDKLTAFEWLRGLAGSLAIIAIFLMAPTRTARNSVQPMNAVGAQGTTAAGTRSMQRGGADEATAARMKRAARTSAGTGAASAMDVSQRPEEVAAATAAVLIGVPGQVPAASAVAEKREFKAFDVVSVKENKGGGDSESNFPLGATNYGYPKTGGVFRGTNYSLALYIAFAYKLNPTQNTSIRTQLQGWALSTRYDIEARVEGEPTKDEMRVMMQALLADRFNLKIHTEQHEAAVYDLELVKPGKMGPGMAAHAADDPACEATKPAYFSPCGAMGVTPTSVMKLSGRNVAIADFADFSGTPAGRPVIDRTGLTGKYDITLDFMLDSAPRTDARPEETGPTFLQAVREQLGMKLEAGKGMVETYVVDGVQRPTGN